MLTINKIASLIVVVCTILALSLTPNAVAPAEGGFATSVGIVGVLSTMREPSELVVSVRLIRDDGRVKWQATSGQMNVYDLGNMLRYSVNLQAGDWNLNESYEWSIRVDARTAGGSVSIVSLTQSVDQSQFTSYGNGSDIQGMVGELLLDGLTSPAYAE